MEYYRWAVEKGWAHTPGWLILSIREDWDAPVGLHAHQRRNRDPRRYADWMK